LQPQLRPQPSQPQPPTGAAPTHVSAVVRPLGRPGSRPALASDAETLTAETAARAELEAFLDPPDAPGDAVVAEPATVATPEPAAPAEPVEAAEPDAVEKADSAVFPEPVAKNVEPATEGAADATDLPDPVTVPEPAAEPAADATQTPAADTQTAAAVAPEEGEPVEAEKPGRRRRKGKAGAQ
jgi:nicotinate-nucleotide--dimethylbenzimidazole phosphoribosyltransferase